jgi:hypothetical protein
LHHPDKGGDAHTFKIIHKGYTEGVRIGTVRASKMMQGKAKAKAKVKSKMPEKQKAPMTAKDAREKRRAETKSALALRRVIKKVREATPDTLESLEKELQAELDRELERCGDLKRKMQEEAKRGLAQGRRHVEYLRRAEESVKEKEEMARKASHAASEESERARRKLMESMTAAEDTQNSQEALRSLRVKRPRAKPVPANATKAKLQATITRWDTGNFKGKTMPDDVQFLPAEQAADWLKEGSCTPVDVRSEKDSGLPGGAAASFTYFQLLTAPEEVASEVHRLREEGKRLLIFSQDGAAMGPCGLVGSLLLDVFGFEDECVFRLQGGFDALKPLMSSGADDGATLESALNARKALAAARKAQKEADAALARAKADLVVFDSASREHLDVLAKGTWDSEDIARSHLAQLSPLLKPLKLESSLVAMLNSAALKLPQQRGPFDSMVFEELGKRFAEKIKALHEEVTDAALRVSQEAIAVKAAAAEVDATRSAGSPKKAATTQAEAKRKWNSELLQPAVA